MSSQTVKKYEVPLWRTLIVYAVIIGVVLAIIYRLVNLQVLGQQ